MSRTIAILGLGDRGIRWAQDALRAGWQVAVFDPDPVAGAVLATKRAVRRESGISATVRHADWVVLCLPERQELIRTVIQRAQGEEPDATLAVSTRLLDAETVQGCATRPGSVVRVTRNDDGGFDVFVTERNGPEFRAETAQTLSELAAVTCLDTSESHAGQPTSQNPDAASA